MLDKIEDRINNLQLWFEREQKTLSVAESCTGGLLSAKITARAGVSSFYLGGVTSYSNSVKEQVLGVPSHLLLTLGAVSSPVAKFMARGVRESLQSDYSISTTGIAGPDGGTEDKPVGTVFFAVNGPGIDNVVKKVFESKQRQQIQLESVLFALDFLSESIQA